MHSFSEIIAAVGSAGIIGAVFAESCIIFFLPGDSLLFTAGLLASQGILNIYVLIIGCVLAAIIGNSIGYYIGRTFGERIFTPDSRLFKQEYSLRTQEFYGKYGKKTIILSRFVPIVRTFAPIMAGVGKMEYGTFLIYNIIGAVLWAGGFLALSYYLGTRFSGLEHYLSYIIVGIIIVSVIPVIVDILRKK
jgi:membrane-associated protein